MSSTNLRETMLARVRTECAAEVSATALAVKQHRELLEDLAARSLTPGSADLMIKHLSDNALENPTPERLEAHAAILATLKSISQNRDVQRQASATVNQKYAAAEGPILALVRAASDSLERQLAELQAAEQAFFAGFGLPAEQTSVSRAAISMRSIFNSEAFARGLDQINRPGSDCTPTINVGGLEILLQRQTG
jgi:hypothetical protein